MGIAAFCAAALVTNNAAPAQTSQARRRRDEACENLDIVMGKTRTVPGTNQFDMMRRMSTGKTVFVLGTGTCLHEHPALPAESGAKDRWHKSQ
jgi:hypothetical protein